MKFTEPHFFLHKTQRNALLILMILLMGFIFLSQYFLVFVSPTSSLEETVMEYYQKKLIHWISTSPRQQFCTPLIRMD